MKNILFVLSSLLTKKKWCKIVPTSVVEPILKLETYLKYRIWNSI